MTEPKTINLSTTGIQGARGRNGYFVPTRVEVVRVGSATRYDVVRVDVFAARSRDYGPAWFEVSPEEARELAAALLEVAR